MVIDETMIDISYDDCEPCPCGSGKEYKGCCKGKKDCQVNDKIPLDVQQTRIMQSALPKICLHPEKEQCSGPIKRAHALQNNKIISLLEEDGHVYTLDHYRPKTIEITDERKRVQKVIKLIGRNDASCSLCFCDYHDTHTFLEIENGAPVYDGSEKMSFLYAYKAFSFDYYKVYSALLLFRAFFKNYPEKYSCKEAVYLYRELKARLDEFDKAKKFYDGALIERSYGELCTIRKRLPFAVGFATYAYVAPNTDMNERRIKNSYKGAIHRLAITAFPESDHSWVLISCRKSEKTYYKQLFAQINKSTISDLERFLSRILPMYSDNIVISPRLWDRWSEKEKRAFRWILNAQGPYAEANAFVIEETTKHLLAKDNGQSGRGRIMNLFERLY